MKMGHTSRCGYSYSKLVPIFIQELTYSYLIVKCLVFYLLLYYHPHLHCLSCNLFWRRIFSWLFANSQLISLKLANIWFHWNLPRNPISFLLFLFFALKSLSSAESFFPCITEIFACSWKISNIYLIWFRDLLLLL